MLPLPKGAAHKCVLLFLVSLLIREITSEGRVVCYYTNWSVYRPGTAKFNPQNINPYLCTHLIYAFGGFTKDNTLKPFDKYQDVEQGGYTKFTGLKAYNKNLKTLLAIGGWNEGSSRFSPLVASPERRQQFIRNILKFLRQNHFDGLDLDWEYPAFRDGGKPRDKENYAQFVQELRAEFDRESSKTGRPRLLLTMAVPAGIEYIEKGYDIPKLNKYLDWFNILSYDFHSAYEPSVNHHSPLYSLEEESEYNYDTELNIDYTIKYYLNAGAERDKLVLGIPTYGRTYTLVSDDITELGSPADGPGDQGDATREKGYLAYYEICQNLRDDPDWTVVQPNPKAMGPYAFRGNQWVGYDDIAIVRKKAEYVAENGLGGIMFWSIDNDDFRGSCGGKPYPLIEAAKEALLDRLGIGDNEVARPSPPKKPSRSRSRLSSASRNNVISDSSTYKSVDSVKKQSSRRNSNKKRVNRISTTSSTTTTTTPSSLYIGGRTTTPPPPTTPDPGADFKCEEEGFFPHPRDCKKYFWCLDSGPSDLGIVAHQFTCPSGLFFNKAADSCDFSRNVLCKTSKSTTTARPSTTTTPTTTTTSSPRITAATSRQTFVRYTSTTAEPDSEEEEYEDEEENIHARDGEEEDPKVIKELIELIRKVGGLEELEKQLLQQDDGSMVLKNSKTDQIPTTPPSISKSLYHKVLSRPSHLNSFKRQFETSKLARSTVSPSIESEEENVEVESSKNSDSRYSSVIRNSRPSPQNAGIDKLSEFEGFLKEKPKYVTINRTRPTAAISESNRDEEEDDDDDTSTETVEEPTRDSKNRRVESSSSQPTTSTPSYVNIRRSRPTTAVYDNQEITEAEKVVSSSAKTSYQPLNRRRLSTVVPAEEQVTTTPQISTTSRYKYIERTKPTAAQSEDQKTSTVLSKDLNLDEDASPVTVQFLELNEYTTLSPTQKPTTTRTYENTARRTTLSTGPSSTVTETATSVPTTVRASTTNIPITISHVILSTPLSQQTLQPLDKSSIQSTILPVTDRIPSTPTASGLDTEETDTTEKTDIKKTDEIHQNNDDEVTLTDNKVEVTSSSNLSNLNLTKFSESESSLKNTNPSLSEVEKTVTVTTTDKITTKSTDTSTHTPTQTLETTTKEFSGTVSSPRPFGFPRRRTRPTTARKPSSAINHVSTTSTSTDTTPPTQKVSSFKTYNHTSRTTSRYESRKSVESDSSYSDNTGIVGKTLEIVNVLSNESPPKRPLNSLSYSDIDTDLDNSINSHPKRSYSWKSQINRTYRPWQTTSADTVSAISDEGRYNSRIYNRSSESESIHLEAKDEFLEKNRNYQENVSTNSAKNRRIRLNGNHQQTNQGDQVSHDNSRRTINRTSEIAGNNERKSNRILQSRVRNHNAQILKTQDENSSFKHKEEPLKNEQVNIDQSTNNPRRVSSLNSTTHHGSGINVKSSPHDRRIKYKGSKNISEDLDNSRSETKLNSTSAITETDLLPISKESNSSLGYQINKRPLNETVRKSFTTDLSLRKLQELENPNSKAPFKTENQLKIDKISTEDKIHIKGQINSTEFNIQSLQRNKKKVQVLLTANDNEKLDKESNDMSEIHESSQGLNQTTNEADSYSVESELNHSRISNESNQRSNMPVRRRVIKKRVYRVRPNNSSDLPNTGEITLDIKAQDSNITKSSLEYNSSATSTLGENKSKTYAISNKSVGSFIEENSTETIVTLGTTGSVTHKNSERVSGITSTERIYQGNRRRIYDIDDNKKTNPIERLQIDNPLGSGDEITEKEIKTRPTVQTNSRDFNQIAHRRRIYNAKNNSGIEIQQTNQSQEKSERNENDAQTFIRRRERIREQVEKKNRPNLESELSSLLAVDLAKWQFLDRTSIPGGGTVVRRRRPVAKATTESLSGKVITETVTQKPETIISTTPHIRTLRYRSRPTFHSSSSQEFDNQNEKTLLTTAEKGLEVKDHTKMTQKSFTSLEENTRPTPTISRPTFKPVYRQPTTTEQSTTEETPTIKSTTLVNIDISDEGTGNEILQIGETQNGKLPPLWSVTTSSVDNIDITTADGSPISTMESLSYIDKKIMQSIGIRQRIDKTSVYRTTTESSTELEVNDNTAPQELFSTTLADEFITSTMESVTEEELNNGVEKNSSTMSNIPSTTMFEEKITSERPMESKNEVELFHSTTPELTSTTLFEKYSTMTTPTYPDLLSTTISDKYTATESSTEEDFRNKIEVTTPNTPEVMSTTSENDVITESSTKSIVKSELETTTPITSEMPPTTLFEKFTTAKNSSEPNLSRKFESTTDISSEMLSTTISEKDTTLENLKEGMPDTTPQAYSKISLTPILGEHFTPENSTQGKINDEHEMNTASNVDTSSPTLFDKYGSAEINLNSKFESTAAGELVGGKEIEISTEVNLDNDITTNLEKISTNDSNHSKESTTEPTTTSIPPTKTVENTHPMVTEKSRIEHNNSELSSLSLTKFNKTTKRNFDQKSSISDEAIDENYQTFEKDRNLASPTIKKDGRTLSETSSSQSRTNSFDRNGSILYHRKKYWEKIDRSLIDQTDSPIIYIGKIPSYNPGRTGKFSPIEIEKIQKIFSGDPGNVLEAYEEAAMEELGKNKILEATEANEEHFSTSTDSYEQTQPSTTVEYNGDISEDKFFRVRIKQPTADNKKMKSGVHLDQDIVETMDSNIRENQVSTLATIKDPDLSAFSETTTESMYKKQFFRNRSSELIGKTENSEESFPDLPTDSTPLAFDMTTLDSEDYKTTTSEDFLLPTTNKILFFSVNSQKPLNSKNSEETSEFSVDRGSIGKTLFSQRGSTRRTDTSQLNNDINDNLDKRNRLGNQNEFTLSAKETPGRKIVSERSGIRNLEISTANRYRSTSPDSFPEGRNFRFSNFSRRKLTQTNKSQEFSTSLENTEAATIASVQDSSTEPSSNIFQREGTTIRSTLIFLKGPRPDGRYAEEHGQDVVTIANLNRRYDDDINVEEHIESEYITDINTKAEYQISSTIGAYGTNTDEDTSTVRSSLIFLKGPKPFQKLDGNSKEDSTDFDQSTVSNLDEFLTRTTNSENIEKPTRRPYLSVNRIQSTTEGSLTAPTTTTRPYRNFKRPTKVTNDNYEAKEEENIFEENFTKSPLLSNKKRPESKDTFTRIPYSPINRRKFVNNDASTVNTADGISENEDTTTLRTFPLVNRRMFENRKQQTKQVSAGDKSDAHGENERLNISSAQNTTKNEDNSRKRIFSSADIKDEVQDNVNKFSGIKIDSDQIETDKETSSISSESGSTQNPENIIVNVVTPSRNVYSGITREKLGSQSEIGKKSTEEIDASSQSTAEEIVTDENEDSTTRIYSQINRRKFTTTQKVDDETSNKTEDTVDDTEPTTRKSVFGLNIRKFPTKSENESGLSSLDQSKSDINTEKNEFSTRTPSSSPYRRKFTTTRKNTAQNRISNNETKVAVDNDEETQNEQPVTKTTLSTTGRIKFPTRAPIQNEKVEKIRTSNEEDAKKTSAITRRIYSLNRRRFGNKSNEEAVAPNYEGTGIVVEDVTETSNIGLKKTFVTDVRKKFAARPRANQANEVEDTIVENKNFAKIEAKDETDAEATTAFVELEGAEELNEQISSSSEAPQTSLNATESTTSASFQSETEETTFSSENELSTLIPSLIDSEIQNNEANLMKFGDKSEDTSTEYAYSIENSTEEVEAFTTSSTQVATATDLTENGSVTPHMIPIFDLQTGKTSANSENEGNVETSIQDEESSITNITSKQGSDSGGAIQPSLGIIRRPFSPITGRKFNVNGYQENQKSIEQTGVKSSRRAYAPNIRARFTTQPPIPKTNTVNIEETTSLQNKETSEGNTATSRRRFGTANNLSITRPRPTFTKLNRFHTNPATLPTNGKASEIEESAEISEENTARTLLSRLDLFRQKFNKNIGKESEEGSLSSSTEKNEQENTSLSVNTSESEESADNEEGLNVAEAIGNLQKSDGISNVREDENVTDIEEIINSKDKIENIADREEKDSKPQIKTLSRSNLQRKPFVLTRLRSKESERNNVDEDQTEDKVGYGRLHASEKQLSPETSTMDSSVDEHLTSTLFDSNVPEFENATNVNISASNGLNWEDSSTKIVNNTNKVTPSIVNSLNLNRRFQNISESLRSRAQINDTRNVEDTTRTVNGRRVRVLKLRRPSSKSVLTNQDEVQNSEKERISSTSKRPFIRKFIRKRPLGTTTSSSTQVESVDHDISNEYTKDDDTVTRKYRKVLRRVGTASDNNPNLLKEKITKGLIKPILTINDTTHLQNVDEMNRTSSTIGEESTQSAENITSSEESQTENEINLSTEHEGDVGVTESVTETLITTTSKNKFYAPRRLYRPTKPSLSAITSTEATASTSRSYIRKYSNNFNLPKPPSELSTALGNNEEKGDLFIRPLALSRNKILFRDRLNRINAQQEEENEDYDEEEEEEDSEENLMLEKESGIKEEEDYENEYGINKPIDEEKIIPKLSKSALFLPKSKAIALEPTNIEQLEEIEKEQKVEEKESLSSPNSNNRAYGTINRSNTKSPGIPNLIIRLNNGFDGESEKSELEVIPRSSEENNDSSVSYEDIEEEEHANIEEVEDEANQQETPKIFSGFYKPTTKSPLFNSFPSFSPKIPSKTSKPRVINRPNFTTVHPASLRLGITSALPDTTQPTLKITNTRTYERKYFPTSTDSTLQDNSLLEDLNINALNARNKKIFEINSRKHTTTKPKLSQKELSSSNNYTSGTEITFNTTQTEEQNNSPTNETLNNFDHLQENVLENVISSPTTTRRPMPSTTTAKITTLYHIFALSEEDDSTTENNNYGDEVITNGKKEKLVEINRVVEVYSKEDKLKVNSKGKDGEKIESSKLKLEKNATIEKLGEIGRVTLVKLVESGRRKSLDDGGELVIEGRSTVADYTPTEPTTTDKEFLPVRNSIPVVDGSSAQEEKKEARKLQLPEVILSVETSTIPLEGLFETPRKSKDLHTKDGPVYASSLGEVHDAKSSNSRSAETAFEATTFSSETTVLSSSPETTTESPPTSTLQAKIEKSTNYVRPLVPLLRPESNESSPLVISIANLDKVILSKVPRSDSSVASSGRISTIVEAPKTIPNDATVDKSNDNNSSSSQSRAETVVQTQTSFSSEIKVVRTKLPRKAKSSRQRKATTENPSH